jgi:hypothetical protein
VQAVHVFLARDCVLLVAKTLGGAHALIRVQFSL